MQDNRDMVNGLESKGTNRRISGNLKDNYYTTKDIEVNWMEKGNKLKPGLKANARWIKDTFGQALQEAQIDKAFFMSEGKGGKNGQYIFDGIDPPKCMEEILSQYKKNRWLFTSSNRELLARYLIELLPIFRNMVDHKEFKKLTVGEYKKGAVVLSGEESDEEKKNPLDKTDIFREGEILKALERYTMNHWSELYRDSIFIKLEEKRVRKEVRAKFYRDQYKETVLWMETWRAIIGGAVSIRLAEAYEKLRKMDFMIGVEIQSIYEYMSEKYKEKERPRVNEEKVRISDQWEDACASEIGRILKWDLKNNMDGYLKEMLGDRTEKLRNQGKDLNETLMEDYSFLREKALKELENISEKIKAEKEALIYGAKMGDSGAADDIRMLFSIKKEEVERRKNIDFYNTLPLQNAGNLHKDLDLESFSTL